MKELEWVSVNAKLPEKRQVVWLLDLHWKNLGAMSAEIKGYQFNGEGFINWDDRGQGSEAIYPPFDDGLYWLPEVAISLSLKAGRVVE